MSKRLVWRKDGQSEPARTSRMDGWYLDRKHFSVGVKFPSCCCSNPPMIYHCWSGYHSSNLSWLVTAPRSVSVQFQVSFLQPNGTRTGSSRAGYGIILEPPPSYVIAGDWNPISSSCENQNWIKISKVIGELELN